VKTENYHCKSSKGNGGEDPKETNGRTRSQKVTKNWPNPKIRE